MATRSRKAAQAVTESKDDAPLQHETPQSTAGAACEACRKLKVHALRMRCIRPPGQPLTDPCERCSRNDRTCTIPQRKPQGRKPGARGRYHGFEKAYRKMQSELRKAKISSDSARQMQELTSDATPGEDETEILQMLLAEEGGDIPQMALADRLQSQDAEENVVIAPMAEPSNIELVMQSTPTEIQPSPRSTEDISASREPINNPLALLADASSAAQALHHTVVQSIESPASNIDSVHSRQSSSYSSGSWLARRLLSRPGYVSLGLQTNRTSLEQGLEAVFTATTEREYRHLNYFKPAGSGPSRDVGPDLDPVDLGLVTMEEAYYLFPIYFARLHPFNGILDPLLHTPEFVKDRSALLFTWILAITAQFDHSSSVLAKRLRLHGEKLSKHVHSSGFKSVEIVQGYYISLLSATPAKTMAEERLWLYTNHAFGVAVELGLDQRAPLRNPGSTGNSLAATRISSPLPTAFLDHQPAEGEFAFRDPTYAISQRLARNRERTWLRILLWERANSAACGRMTTFPETELTQNIENWWLHPLADSADRFTCALILLRRQLAALHVDLRAHAALPHHSNPHWVLKQINSTLQPWIQEWIPLLSNSSAPSSYETDIAQIYLYYVYIHGCLWTLCYALYCISKSTQNKEDVHAIREDCFEAAVKACEFAVRDLQTVGEPLYGMLSPTWAMISYAAVLALQLFPLLYGTRPGSEVELLSLLGQVALQLERAGSTPSHRFGIAAMLGQHLLMILRTRTASLRDSAVHPENNEEVMLLDQQQYENGVETSDLQPYSHLLTGFDPFLIPMPTPSDMECNGEAFADIFRELFGQGFGGVF